MLSLQKCSWFSNIYPNAQTSPKANSKMSFPFPLPWIGFEGRRLDPNYARTEVNKPLTLLWGAHGNFWKLRKVRTMCIPDRLESPQNLFFSVRWTTCSNTAWLQRGISIVCVAHFLTCRRAILFTWFWNQFFEKTYWWPWKIKKNCTVR